MGPYRHVSVAFFKWYIFLKGIFVDAPIIMKINPLIFWWNWLKLHNNFPRFSHSYSMLWQVNIISQYHSFSFLCLNTMIYFDLSNKTYHIQSRKLVHFRVDKPSIPSEVMYLCESWWMVFSIYLYIFSEIHFPFSSC